MEYTDMTIVFSIIAALAGLCSILAFLLGRKSEAKKEGEYKGKLDANIQTLTSSITGMQTSLTKIEDKIETSSEKSDRKYEELLIMSTKLDSSYKSIHIRVDNIEREMNEIRRVPQCGLMQNKQN